MSELSIDIIEAMKLGIPIALFTLIISSTPLSLVMAMTLQDPEEAIERLRSNGYSIQYIDEEVSIEKIAIELKEEKSNFYYLKISDLVDMLKRWNHHVITYTNLKGEYIYTESPADPYLSYEYIPELPLNKDRPQERLAYTTVTPVVENEVKREIASATKLNMPAQTSIEELNLDYTELSARKYTFFAHVTVSQGFFNEEISSSSIENQQNSPLTFGVGTHVRFTPSLAMASSVYFSKLNASEIDNSELDQSELKVNDEIGANLYLEYKIPDTNYSIYGGVDYEQFTTLNLDDIIAGSSNVVSTNQEKMTFATVGFSFFTKIFLPSAIKVSASPIISSNTNFSGYKYMLYVNQKITDNTWYHFLLKQHQLEQDSRTVSITRYGFGVGVTF